MAGAVHTQTNAPLRRRFLMAPRPLSARTQRLLDLGVGRSAFAGGDRPDDSLRVIERRHPERCFEREDREGGHLVTRLPDRAR